MKKTIKEYKNILEHAEDIIFNRAEEKERQYGPLKESMEDTAKVASIMCNKNLTAIDIYKVLISLKLSRMKWSIKYDTLLDAAAYIGGLNDYNIKQQDVKE